jgi:hypothetical protein
MKIRSGFVSNSSSSSFVIERKNLTYKQINQIKNHISCARSMGDKYAYIYDRWFIYEDFPENYERDDKSVKRKKRKGTIEGTCNMNNFDMHNFFEKIGVNMENVKWEFF